MANCANCSREAFYVYNITAEFNQYFCSMHLPRFLRDQRNGGAVSKYEAPVVAKPSKKTAPEPVIEESAEEDGTS